MTYSKMPEHQVTVVATPRGLACLMCNFGDITEMNILAESTQEMIDHIEAHRRVGDLLPDDIEDRLRADDAQNYPKGAPS